MEIKHQHSPNSSSRYGAIPLATIIHFDASPFPKASIDWLCNPASQASAHALIDRDGRVTEMVDPQLAAWHAGVGELTVAARTYHDPKVVSIGIELANCGLLAQHDSRLWCIIRGKRYPYAGATSQLGSMTYPDGKVVEGSWEPFPEEQLLGLDQYLADLALRGYGTAANNCLGHDEIARPWGRKSDPGPLFPWSRFPRHTPRPLVNG